jgi:hypothetical protein
MLPIYGFLVLIINATTYTRHVVCSHNLAAGRDWFQVASVTPNVHITCMHKLKFLEMAIVLTPTTRHYK